MSNKFDKILGEYREKDDGLGNVVGPLSNASTDNAFVTWDGITGKLIKDSGVVVNTASAITNGLLNAGDYVVFNNKQNALTPDSDYLTPTTAFLTYAPISGSTNYAPSTITIATVEANSSITPVADGTYALPTSITIVNGIITAIS